MIKKLPKNDGFTLMETMIYIALFAIIISGALVGTYNLIEGGNKNITSTGLQEEGTFINRKTSWALSAATNVAVSGGGTTLTITRPDLAAQSPLVISGTGSNMTIQRGAGVAVPLNSDRFVVSNAVFSCVPTNCVANGSGRPVSVSLDFEVNAKPFTFRYYLRQ